MRRFNTKQSKIASPGMDSILNYLCLHRIASDSRDNPKYELKLERPSRQTMRIKQPSRPTEEGEEEIN